MPSTKTEKVWKILPKVSDPDLIGADNLKTQLLYNRGLKTEKEIDEFFNPKLENYEKDLQISGIPLAQKRIQKAIKNQELIIVYGDYDVDGVCACAILYKALTSLGAKVLPYIPHREKEGYGMSKTGLEFARNSGASVVITVDNGIVAIDQAKFAKELGLDLIITDHHIPLSEKPEALVIIHSVKMCGAAVAWCLIRNLVKEDLKKELLQFAAIATICDMLPLIDLGRAFVVEGLKILNHTKNLGLLELTKQSGVEIGNIGSYEIGHVIGPRINAIGRLDHAVDALRLLCTKDPMKARTLANLLGDKNIERQRLTLDGVEEAKTLVNGNGLNKIHVLDSKNWSAGIIGLIAARICEEYYRPAIAISVGITHSKGSARSIKGINIVELIRNCCEYLIDVGGHSGAAGFSILNENIPKFREKLEKLMENAPVMEKTLEIEAEVETSRLTKSLVKEIESFAPFGLGNPVPVLATKNMKVSDIRTVGSEKHLKFKADGIDAIYFGGGMMKDIITNGQLANLAYNFEINKFNGREILQLKIKDMLF